MDYQRTMPYGNTSDDLYYKFIFYFRIILEQKGAYFMSKSSLLRKKKKTRNFQNAFKQQFIENN
ncbi:997_t:CDS:2 [Funneliformis mosseae]|uniref:997_t:CDS:1 n=1 Tax=Funneliformis mosseae TaxID=27381 RepID=A0A9N9BAW7_FUNMO|nr:997_t:CDS:2 [Funneliformis mosseae]